MYSERQENYFGKRIWKKLKNIRKFKKITQEKLAEMIDMDIRQIARLEAGESMPSVLTVMKLCRTFNLTPNDLLLSGEEFKINPLKSDIYDIIQLAKPEQLELIKKLILAIL